MPTASSEPRRRRQRTVPGPVIRAAASSAHCRTRSGQRGAKRQPGGSAARLGTCPGSLAGAGSSPGGSGRAASECQQSPRVYGCCGASNELHRPALSRRRARHTSRPRVGDLGDDAEIVRDEQDRHAQFALQLAQQLEDLRLDRDVERRRRLVGDQQLRAGTTAPSRSSRAAACRRTSGADSRRTRRSRIGDADELAASRSRDLAAPRALSTRWCSMTASAIWSPIVKTGLRDVIGSWKIMRDLVAADRAHLAFEKRSRSRPWSRYLPAQRSGPAAGSAAGSTGGDRLAAARIRRRPRRSRRA